MLRLIPIALLLAGCASVPNPNMTADQITAAGKDKALSVTCAHITGLWGSGDTVIITYDQRALANGGVSVDPTKGCAATLTNMQSAPPK